MFGFVLAGWLAAGAALGSDAERLARRRRFAALHLPEGGGRRPWPGVGRAARPPACRRPIRAASARHSSFTNLPREQVVTLVGQLRQDASVLPQGVGLALDVEQLTRGSHASPSAAG